MFGWGSSRESSASAAATETAATPGLPLPPPPANRTLESLVQEELPIQRHSVQMEGGMPSCLTLFDQFFLCYSLGSQIKSVYRHGTPRDCMPKFEDFKFCMSVKGLADDRRDEVWAHRRAEWWARRRLGKSSEDVWDARRDVYSDPLDEKRRPRALEATDATAAGSTGPAPAAAATAAAAAA